MVANRSSTRSTALPFEGKVIGRKPGCLVRQGTRFVRPEYLTSRQAQARDLLLDHPAEGLRRTDTIERLMCAAHAIKD
jgi:hypothetical protein